MFDKRMSSVVTLMKTLLDSCSSEAQTTPRTSRLTETLIVVTSPQFEKEVKHPQSLRIWTTAPPEWRSGVVKIQSCHSPKQSTVKSPFLPRNKLKYITCGHSKKEGDEQEQGSYLLDTSGVVPRNTTVLHGVFTKIGDKTMMYKRQNSGPHQSLPSKRFKILPFRH